MTIQARDRVILEGRTYEIARKKDDVLLTPRDFGITNIGMRVTACLRGYISTYSLIDNHFFLTALFIWGAKESAYPPIDGVEAKVHDELSLVQYFNLHVSCAFSGGIIFVDDLIRTCYTPPTPLEYRTVKEVILDCGRITQIIDHSEVVESIRSQLKQMKRSNLYPFENIDEFYKSAKIWRETGVFDDKTKLYIEETERKQQLQWSFAPGYAPQPLIYVNEEEVVR